MGLIEFLAIMAVIAWLVIFVIIPRTTFALTLILIGLMEVIA